MLCGPRTWHGVLVVLAGVSALGGVQNGGFEVINTPEEFPPWQNEGAVIYPDAQLPNPMFCDPEPIVAPDGSSRFAGKVANWDNVEFWLGQIVDVYAPGGETLAVSLNAYYYLSSHQNETGHDEYNVRLYWEMGYKSDGSDPADMYDADTWMYLLPPPHYVDGTLTQAGGM
nr:hypothetical protein [Gemmatimonadales bacterium]